MNFVTFPCLGCNAEIQQFKVSIDEANSVTLRLQCHPCRTTSYIHLSFESINCLARGKPVALSESPPGRVM